MPICASFNLEISNMRTYIAFYKRQQITVTANSSYEAQQKAAAIFKAKKAYDVTVMLADVTHSTASV
jgi:hypothetical protein